MNQLSSSPALEGEAPSAQAVEAALARSLIAIPSVNGARLLRRMLPSLRVPPSLVVVIDQASDDDTERVCAEAGVTLHQAGERLTYTQACNLGARLARERGCDFVFVGNNDIVFTTDVCRELLAAMLADQRLGVVAPSQVIVNEKTGEQHIAYRVHWQLDRLIFHHDFTPPPLRARRIESDFCELTFVLTRLSILDEVGFLDDEYGFYHEDADFGFRLGAAGYSSAYLPHSQIEHFASSTFSTEPNERKEAYLRRNRQLFAERHLGYGVDHRGADPATPAALVSDTDTLDAYLRRMALLDPSRPRLSLTRGLAEAGPDRAFQLPPAVETDIFHPWDEGERLMDGPTIAWFHCGEADEALAELMAGWERVRARHPEARLLLIGALDAGFSSGEAADCWRRGGMILCRSADGSRLTLVIEREQSAEERARLLRGVDATLWTSGNLEARIGAARSLACGVPAILAQGAGMDDLVVAGTPRLAGAKAEEIARAIDEMLALAPEHRAALGHAGVLRVRQRLTWRHALHALRAELQAGQTRSTPAQAARPPEASATAGWAPRQIRRAAWLLTIFADDWQDTGLRHAARSMAERMMEVFKGRWRSLLPRRRAAATPTPPALAERVSEKPGPLFLGYVEAGLGLGESLRAMVGAYAAGGRPFGVYPFNVGVETRRIGPFLPERYDQAGRYDLTVMEVAVEQVPAVFSHVDPRIVQGSRIALRTYWELAEAPAAWRPMLAGIDEIWAPNSFVAESLRGIFDGPIAIVPPCVQPETEKLPGRAHFKIDPDRFTFLFTFDYFSFPQRKNPQAVLAAFQDAFPDRSEPVGLILKSTGAARHYPELKRAFLKAAQDDPRIRIIDKTLSRREVHGLIAAADCYVSLHRAEGFGFGMAEAMYFGRPVIGTAYSGNVDFLTEETGFPVNYRLRPIRPGDYVWARGQVWAEPDHDSAVAAFRAVHGDPELRRRRAQAGRALIHTAYGPEAVRAAVEARLDRATEKPASGVIGSERAAPVGGQIVR